MLVCHSLQAQHDSCSESEVLAEFDFVVAIANLFGLDEKAETVAVRGDLRQQVAAPETVDQYS